jgi:hypothetical protein
VFSVGIGVRSLPHPESLADLPEKREHADTHQHCECESQTGIPFLNGVAPDSEGDRVHGDLGACGGGLHGLRGPRCRSEHAGGCSTSDPLLARRRTERKTRRVSDAAAREGLLSLQVRQDSPDFLDLPWTVPLPRWGELSPRVVEVQRGLSRHEVVFVSYGGVIYAIKELPPRLAEREYDLLRALEERALPSVLGTGHARIRRADGEKSLLFTRYLEASLPYRTLFMDPGLERYRERLLDAISGLLVRLHLAGFYWGDCSLSNTLFRRDAGELTAYAVDAETSELHEGLSDGQREQDLMILEENIAGELADLAALGALPNSLSVYETGENICQRYRRLWSEIRRETVIAPHETYRIQERIRALNELGFSVGEFELVASRDGHDWRLRTIVTDRDYHRHLLHSLTGVVATDAQAVLLLNEIKELKATLARELNRSVALSVAGSHWLERRFRPTALRLCAARPKSEPCELYCQLLEHKWYLSERAQRDVGLDAAVDDFLRRS